MILYDSGIVPEPRHREGLTLSVKEAVVYVDGEFYPKSQAKISVYDHGLLYGDGVFEGIREYDGVVFRLDEHIDRLYESARMIKLDIPLGRDGVVEVIMETLRRNDLKDAYIRLVVTRGTGDLGVDPRKCREPSLVIIAEHVEPSFVKRARENGISVIVSSYRRDAVDATTHEIKSLNYLNCVLAKQEAIEFGADDAIMLDRRGFVSEATTTNIFLVKNQAVATPPPVAGILHGITRKRVMELASELGYRCEERDITPFELTNADEVFVTGTLAEVVPVVKIRGIMVGDGKPGPITRSLIQAFDLLKGNPAEGAPVYATPTVSHKSAR